MRARRMRRRVFNLFAFAFLAFAIYLIAFTKEESMQTSGQTAHAVKASTSAADKTSH
jgi:hypothetical protein